MDPQDGVRPGDREQPDHDGARPGELQQDAGQFGVLPGPQQDVQPGRVAEAQLGEVHQDPGQALLRQPGERRAQPVRRVAVELSPDGHDPHRSGAPHVDAQLPLVPIVPRSPGRQMHGWLPVRSERPGAVRTMMPRGGTVRTDGGHRPVARLAGLPLRQLGRHVHASRLPGPGAATREVNPGRR